MKEPKVLVGVVTYDGHCHSQDLVLHSISEMNYSNKKIIVIDNSKTMDNTNHLRKLGYEVYHMPWKETAMERVVQAREFVRVKTLEGGYDFQIHFDADWILPTHTITTLIQNDKDVCGILCRIKGKYGPPCVFKTGTQNQEDKHIKLDVYTWEEIMDLKPRLIKVHGAPAVCVKRKVLAEIPWRYCPGMGEDIIFYKECEDKGFEVWCDLSIHARHFQAPPVAWMNKPKLKYIKVSKSERAEHGKFNKINLKRKEIKDINRAKDYLKSIGVVK